MEYCKFPHYPRISVQKDEAARPLYERAASFPRKWGGISTSLTQFQPARPGRARHAVRKFDHTPYAISIHAPCEGRDSAKIPM